MDIEQLKKIAAFHFRQIRSNCTYLKISVVTPLENGNYMFFALFKCKRGVNVKQVILTSSGEFVGSFSR